MDADEIIEHLGLEPHPEGGFFRETWRHDPGDGSRGAGTAVYFLLKPGQRSYWHRVDADELWLWHGPGTLTLQVGEERVGLGPGVPQVLVPAGTWQAAEPGADEVLVTCVVSPGFVWEGFRLD